MRNFFKEFKTFITRGNVVDMAVGVIVGGAFTAIVNGLSNFILKPVINWLLGIIIGADTLSEQLTFLKRVDTTVEVLDENGAVIGTEIVPDLAESIYIDWGAFINAIINFIIVAFVLFVIVKIANKFREGKENLRSGRATKAERKALKAEGKNWHNREVVAAYRAEIKAKADAEAAEKARLEREANPTTEDLLKMILAELKNK